MSIPLLDTKILWGKANARCSICREKVVEKTPENGGRTDILFGEMCHIVGEKAEGCARCKSSMPLEHRNFYHNLILLCANHHTIVDKDETTYTIERLHQIKTDFELWIDSHLDVASDPADEHYSNLINTVSEELQLSRFDSVSNGAVNGRLPVWFTDGADIVLRTIFKANWPGKRLEFEAHVKSFAEQLSEYLKVYHTNAALDQSGKMFMRLKRYQSAPEASPEKERLVKEYEDWERQCFNLLWNFVIDLNHLAESVRRELNPRFYFFEGKFCIVDEFGSTNGGEAIIYIPEKYRSLTD